MTAMNDTTGFTRTVTANVLVIGTGGAGLRAAIAAHEAGVAVIVVGKRRRGDAHTVLASGGINAALGTRDPEDSWQQHFADTLREGYFLGDPRVVEVVAREAPAAVEQLAEWGCGFARTDDGASINGSSARTAGAARATRATTRGGRSSRRSPPRWRASASPSSRTSTSPASSSPTVRASARSRSTCTTVTARRSWPMPSCSAAAGTRACGAAARRAGTRTSARACSSRCRPAAALMDMELVQFHPTGMVAPEEIAGTLVTEAVRGEGGRLYNSDGERFMSRYDPERMELSTRDRVALANYTEIHEGRGGPHGGVFLDISHRTKEHILSKLPRMYRQFIEYQMLDISKEPMEVAPTAHYSMGGVVVDPETHATDVAGLFAAGECTAGLHGANRLGGNSLTETVVYGRRAGEAAAAFSQESDVSIHPRHVIAEAGDDLDALIGPGDEMARAVQRRLRDLMWDACGVVRNEADLTRAAREPDGPPPRRGRRRRAPERRRLGRPGAGARPPGRPRGRRGNGPGSAAPTREPGLSQPLRLPAARRPMARQPRRQPRRRRASCRHANGRCHRVPADLASWIEEAEHPTMEGRLLE